MRNGILNIYKEKGYTSHDVVAKLRGIVKQRKIGHTGTLDPQAEGVLPVCLGMATRLCDFLTEQRKTYETILLLGKATDTQDLEGTTLSVQETGFLTEAHVRACVEGYVGDYEQLPPMYSALKVNGKKLYELARAGVEVERKRRKVKIHAIQIQKMALPRVQMEVCCSKGTYIRTLCHDIGESLGCGGCMESLLRTQVGRFWVKDSVRLAEIEELEKAGRLEEILLPVDQIFAELPAVAVEGKLQEMAYNGNPLPAEKIKSTLPLQFSLQQVRVYDSGRRFIGVFRYDVQRNLFVVEKMFLDRDNLM